MGSGLGGLQYRYDPGGPKNKCSWILCLIDYIASGPHFRYRIHISKEMARAHKKSRFSRKKPAPFEVAPVLITIAWMDIEVENAHTDLRMTRMECCYSGCNAVQMAKAKWHVGLGAIPNHRCIAHCMV